MSDPRIDTVANILREHGHNSTSDGLTTDDLAKAIVDGLDREHGTPEADDAEATGASVPADPFPSAGNPETPTGTGTEGGAGNPAQ